MERKISNSKSLIAAFIFGMAGCICFGSGDWLMVYGNTNADGTIYWLTDGVANIASWRNTLAMLLAFPGIIFYGIGLFAAEKLIVEPKQRKIYHTLTIYGLTPWLALHLFYIMILYAFAWMNSNGYADAALPICEAVFSHLSWIVMVSEAFMLPPFIYWFYLQFTKKTFFPKSMAFTNVLVIYGILYCIKSFMPDSPFRIGFTNGLMSESMIIWFAIMIIFIFKNKKLASDNS